jgi:hypothetical protein
MGWIMNIDKNQIIDFLRSQGDDQKAEQADRELPNQVDTDSTEDQNLLQRLGIDPGALIQRFLGGRGIPGL